MLMTVCGSPPPTSVYPPPTLKITKLQHRWSGPFRITQKVWELNYKLKLTGQLKGSKIHPVFHVSLLRPFVEIDRFAHDPDDLPPVAAWTDDESATYEVERILKHRIYHGKEQYLIKWGNYNPSDATWEPSDIIISLISSRVIDYGTGYMWQSVPHLHQHQPRLNPLVAQTH
jgi:hypothetical protein